MKFTTFDSAEYLEDEEDILAYFNACIEDGGDDPLFIAHALGVIARARGISDLARKTGISRKGLYKALSAEGNPEFATILKVINALGFRLKAEAKP